jgi:phage-related protein (TIGR01555 family)
MVLGQSRVQTIIDAIMNVDAAENGFAALIKDARNRRIYIPKLLEQVATAEGEAILAKRLQAFALGESSNSVSWLDGGDGEGKGAEKIEDRQMNWAGMPDIMASYRTAAAAASEMPGTVMWGTSPQGMNATGDSDIQLWHKTINGKQDLDLRPRMTKIDAVLIPSALGRVDDKIWYDWAPLSEQSEKDEATTFGIGRRGCRSCKTVDWSPMRRCPRPRKTPSSSVAGCRALAMLWLKYPRPSGFQSLSSPALPPSPIHQPSRSP